MAGSVNKVILIGNLGSDPEIKPFSNGGRVARFSIATSETWKDKNGDRQERTEWHRISVLNENIVGVCEKYLKKGAKVYIEGQLETRKWQDKDTGQDKYSTEIVLRPYRGELTMLDGRNASGGGSDYAPSNDSMSPSSAPRAQQSQQNWQAPAKPDFDDDIPF